MELMKENQAPLDAAWSDNGLDGLDLLLKAAQKTPQPKEAGVKKSKLPSMVLNGSYIAPVIVGRGSQATLNLGKINKQVSRRHAIVQWCNNSSAFQITVLGQNGVRINGVGYPSGQQATLREGDIVDLVGVKMLFRKPSGSPPLQEYLDSTFFEDDELIPMPSGLSTPKRAQNTDRAHQLATPNHSSPIQDSQLTPTARMRHKMLKYDVSSTNRTLFNSPPPSSDAGTEFGSSPVMSRPIFTLPIDASPVRCPIGLQSPKSEASIYWDGQHPKSPSKSSSQRTPLALLSLTKNGQANIAKSHTETGRVLASPKAQARSLPTKSKPNNALKPPTKSAVKGSNIAATSPSAAKEQRSNADLKDTGNKAPIPPTQEVSKASKDSHISIDSQKLVDRVKSKPHKITPSQNSPKASSMKEGVRRAYAEEEISKATQPPPTLGKDQRPTSIVDESSKDIEKKVSTPVQDKDAESDHLSSSSRESSPESQAKKSPMDYTEMIIDTLVFARKKKSMTLSELFDEMIASQPSLMASQDPEEIKEQMLQCLSAARCVGRITRKGKDAYNKPLESQWYYIPECDHNVMRKQTRQEVMPSARKCTLKDKQYFFKMPPKLPYHRKSTSPYAVKASARRTKESSKLSIGGDDEAGEPSSSSSDLDDEVDESEQGTRKRKSANSGLVDKKRKGIVTNPARVEVQRNQDEEDEEDEDIHNDSLDDLSELSGLSD
ncbi:hypothetical protein BGZ58_008641 [Dissophora ornata]|nr:hypothetical protein BGZ58_008641 [Dissophora ornata]